MMFSLLAAVAALAAAGAGLAAGADDDAPAPVSHPDAVALVAPAGAVPGRAVVLAARAPARPALAWDLDGDGRFDDAAGPRAVAHLGAGPHRVAVRAEWRDGPLPVVRTARATVVVSGLRRGAYPVKTARSVGCRTPTASAGSSRPARTSSPQACMSAK